MSRLGLALAIVSILAAGCAADPPSPAPEAELPVACIDLPAATCDRAIEILEERGGGVPVAYAIVAPRACDGVCPGNGALVDLTVEFADGRPPALVVVGDDGAQVLWQPREIAGFLVRVEPTSGPLAGRITETALGHCGLNSPIDLDGSLWNPVGMIDWSHQDLINGVRATFGLESPRVATLRTEGGAVVRLVRHDGPRHYPGCD